MTGRVGPGALLGLGRARPWAPTSDRAGDPPPPGATALRPDEDFDRLSALGCTCVRLPLDWARLQPRTGRLDGRAVEAAAHLLTAARVAGLDPWACLLEDSLPGWFVDEGGFGDARAAGRYWPRFVEQTAEALGDLVAGWVPIDDPAALVERRHGADPRRLAEARRVATAAWRDAWGVLRGGPPVATCAGTGLPPIDPVGAFDVAGIRVAPNPTGAVTDAALGRYGERIGGAVRDAAGAHPDRPVQVTVPVVCAHPEDRARWTEAAVAAILDAVADGVPVTTAFHEPALGGPPAGALLDADHEPTPSAGAWRAVGE